MYGVDVNRPGTLFRRHLDSGQPVSLVTGTASPSGELRMVAQRSVQPAGLSLDRPLVVSVSRSVDAMFAPWLRQTAAYAGLHASIGCNPAGRVIALLKDPAALQAAPLPVTRRRAVSVDLDSFGQA